MGALATLLKQKFKTPQEAIEALGLDANSVQAAVRKDVGRQEEKQMKKPMTRMAAFSIGILAPYVKSKLAADQGVDLRPILCGLTAKDVRDKAPAIAAAIKKACRGKLAKDTTLGEVAEFLDMLKAHGEEVEEADQAVEPPVQSAMESTAMLEPQETPDLSGGDPEKKDIGGEVKDEGPEAVKAFLKGKLSDEDYARACQMLGDGAADVGEEHEKGEEKLKELGAAGGPGDQEPGNLGEGEGAGEVKNEEKDDMNKDQPPEFKGSPKTGGKVSGDAKYVTKDEMEKQIAAAVKVAGDSARKTEREIREAERIVQPWVGNLAMTFDSAPEVFRKALKMMGVPGIDRVHDSALRTILEMQPKPGARKAAAAAAAKVAQDADVQVGSFFDRFPDAGRIGLT